MSWEALNPEDVDRIADAGTMPTPDLYGLLYNGSVHTLMGEPDSGKSMFALALAADLLRNDREVIWIDFEMGAARIIHRLLAFGVSRAQLFNGLTLVSHPVGKPGEFFEPSEFSYPVALVVVDALTGLLSTLNLTSNSDVDIESAYRQVLRPARLEGSPVLVIDHVVKNRENQGRWAVGSQRKIGAPQVALRFDTVRRFKPGMGGRAKITVAKDTDGGIVPCEFVLEPDMTWRLEVADGKWQPTELMTRVSEYLEAAGGVPVSKAQVEKDVRGNSTEHKRLAIDELVRQGFAAASTGPRNAILLTFVRSYAKPEATSPDLASTSPGEVAISTSPPRLSPTRGEVESGEVEWLEQNATSPEDYYDSIDSVEGVDGCAAFLFGRRGIKRRVEGAS
jgi:hypothetical protein